MSSRSVHVAQILWPAFIIAGVLEMVVFAWVDPHSLVLGGWQVDAQAIYTIAFFVFWGFIASSALLSHWMIKSVDHMDAPPAVEPRGRRQARRHARSMA